jgi:hypothetical protein
MTKRFWFHFRTRNDALLLFVTVIISFASIYHMSTTVVKTVPTGTVITFLTKQLRKPLHINPNVTIAADVIGIWHYPTDGIIILETNPNGTCSHPEVRGRLSGPALIVVEWTKQFEDEEQTQLIGTYSNVPFAGTYFLEIFVLLCDGDWDDQTGFTKICLEDPQNHRLTDWNTTIKVEKSVVLHHCKARNMSAYWVSNQYQEQEQGNSSVVQYQSVYTRFQPQGGYVVA